MRMKEVMAAKGVCVCRGRPPSNEKEEDCLCLELLHRHRRSLKGSKGAGKVSCLCGESWMPGTGMNREFILLNFLYLLNFEACQCSNDAKSKFKF